MIFRTDISIDFSWKIWWSFFISIIHLHKNHIFWEKSKTQEYFKLWMLIGRKHDSSSPVNNRQNIKTLRIQLQKNRKNILVKFYGSVPISIYFVIDAPMEKVTITILFIICCFFFSCFSFFFFDFIWNVNKIAADC